MVPRIPLVPAVATLAATFVFAGFPASVMFQSSRGDVPLPWGAMAACLLAGLLAVACSVAMRRQIDDVIQRLATTLGDAPFYAAITFGVLLRLVTVWATDPLPVSDGATYLSLARQLLAGQPYQTAGTVAYWPPGMPFALVPFLLVFGDTQHALVALALLCFVVGGRGVLVLARALGLGAIAVVPVWLFAIWPTNVFCTGLPEKELVVAAVMPWAIHAYRLGLLGAMRMWVVAGLLTGLMVAVQPSLQLFPIAVFVYALVTRRDFARPLIGLTLAVTAMVAMLLPWTIRNYIVLGAPVLVSTNGGSNLYRANNELATGAYVAKGKVDVEALDELSSNSQGRSLAMEWIRAHPGDALQLSATKALLFAGDDSYGPFAAFRGRPGQVPRGVYIALKLTANLYWLALWCGLVAVCFRRAGPWSAEIVDRQAILILPYLYLTVIHSVFESGGKYHLPTVLPLLILLLSASRRPVAESRTLAAEAAA